MANRSLLPSATPALAFQSTTFTPVIRQGQLWLKSAELAKALGYADEKAVHRIYARHDDEFTPCMSLVVKLTTKGFGNGSSDKPVRIFSLRGAHLIAMFARTPVAKDFRKWVLDVLDQQTGQPVIEAVIDHYAGSIDETIERITRLARDPGGYPARDFMPLVNVVLARTGFTFELPEVQQRAICDQLQRIGHHLDHRPQSQKEVIALARVLSGLNPIDGMEYPPFRRLIKHSRA